MSPHRFVSSVWIAFCAVGLVAQTQKHGMTIDDLAKVQRVSPPQVSPDGRWIAYTVSHVESADDKSINQLWMVSWDGKEDIQLTFGKESAGSPRWSPDGRYLAFTSDREGAAKGSQVWLLDRRGGEAQQLTNVKDNLGGYRWSPDSKQLLLTLQAKDEPEPEKGGKPVPPKPIVLDRFHFKEDREGYLTAKQAHLFLFDVASKKLSKLTNGPVDGPTAYAEENPEFSPRRQTGCVCKQPVITRSGSRGQPGHLRYAGNAELNPEEADDLRRP